MACRAPPFWCSAIFIVVGVIIAVLAVVPWFVIPNQVEKAVTELAVVDSKDNKDHKFRDFTDPPENPLIYSCFFWNITNPTEVSTAGAKPILKSVGPYVYKRFQHRFNVSFEKDGEEVLYQEWGEYKYYKNESFAGANPAEDVLYSVNVAYLSAVAGSGYTEQKIGFQAAQANVFTSLKSGLTDPTKGFAVNVLNVAWITLFGSLFTAIGGSVPTLKTLLDNPPTVTYALPITDPSILGASGALSTIDAARLGVLVNPATPGSLLASDAASVNSWLPTNAVAKVGALTQPPFNLSLSEAQALFTYRTINPYKNETQLGGVYYGNVINVAAFTFGISGFTPATPITWLTVLPNFGYRHFGRYSSSGPAYGIITNSLSVIDLDAATNTLLFGHIPEISIWVKNNFAGAATLEFGAIQPSTAEFDFIKGPVDFTQTESQWILDTFAHPAGAVAFGVYLGLIPGVLAQIDAATGNGFYTHRNLTLIQAAAWNSTAVTLSFYGAVLQNNNGSFPFTQLPALTFQKAFQLYIYLKYNIMGSIVKDGSLAIKAGVIFATSAEEWLFGREDEYISALLKTTYNVGGVWSDYNETLALNQPLDRYKTGKGDPKQFRKQVTFETKTTLGTYYAPFDPPVKGSSLTWVGPFRLQDKNGKKTTDEGLLLWVPNVIRELQLIFDSEYTLKGIPLYRYIANAEYETVVTSSDWINPYDFVMNAKNYYTSGLYDFYLTFPGWTLVKEKELFNDKVEGVNQDEENFILFWDIEPITGLAMNARAPLQLSVPIGIGAKWNKADPATYLYNFLSTGLPTDVHLPAWYIVRSNQISDKQASDWKNTIGAAKKLQLGLTIALPLLGFVFILVGVILIILRAVGGKGEDMQEFELRT